MKQTPSRFLKFAFFLCVFNIISIAQPQTFFPDTGTAAIVQRCRDLRGSFHVLSIALRPGDEDFPALSYLRLERGAKVLSAYVTNGETEESDSCDFIPQQNAVIRREEAASALETLESEIHFLNMPDVASISSPQELDQMWSSDTLRLRLARLIGTSKPDIILLPSFSAQYDSLLLCFIRDIVIDVVRDIGEIKNKENIQAQYKVTPWVVDRVLSRTETRNGITLPLSTMHSIWRQSYTAIGRNIYSKYRSLMVHRKVPFSDGQSTYRLLFPLKGKKNTTIDTGLPRIAPRQLTMIENTLHAVTGRILRNIYPSKKYLPIIAALLDSVDRKLVKIREDQVKERQCLIDWKDGLERLRTALMGVHAVYSLDYNTLAERQLVFVTIDTVLHVPPLGTTMIMFPSVNRDWVLNEAKVAQLPLTLKVPYRLLSPVKIQYDVPAESVFQNRTLVDRLFSMILVHRGVQREENFIYRMNPRIRFSQKFSTEVLTPIVRYINGERVVVRLTNHSRDGVSDILSIQDSLVTSNKVAVSLPGKEIFSQDTLILSFNKHAQDGQYMVPIQYGGVNIARFFVKKFTTIADSTNSVLLLTGWRQSQTLGALRELGIDKIRIVREKALIEQDLSNIQTVILDRRLLTLRPLTLEEKKLLLEYASRGGHLLILAQDAKAWNNSPLIEGIQLTPTMRWSVSVPVRFDTSSTIATYPNHLSSGIFDNWIFQRAYNYITSSAIFPSRVTTLFSFDETHPAIITSIVGKGRITYVDLALSPQFMGVHEGVLKLFANFIAFDSVK